MFIFDALYREAVHYFEKLSSSANGFSTAVLILKIINTLRKYDETEDTRKTLGMFICCSLFIPKMHGNYFFDY